jgi:hypothetical protein
MPFSAIDFATLSTHGFLKIYGNYRDRLIVLARNLYQQLKVTSNIPPSVTDCELFFEFELLMSTVYADIVADLCAGIVFPTEKDQYWQIFFNGPVARYVVDKEWLDIVI